MPAHDGSREPGRGRSGVRSRLPGRAAAALAGSAFRTHDAHRSSRRRPSCSLRSRSETSAMGVPQRREKIFAPMSKYFTRVSPAYPSCALHPRWVCFRSAAKRPADPLPLAALAVASPSRTHQTFETPHRITSMRCLLDLQRVCKRLYLQSRRRLLWFPMIRLRKPLLRSQCK